VNWSLPRTQHRPPRVLAVAAATAAAFAVVPLFYIAIRASEGGLSGIKTELWRRQTGQLLVRSLTLAGAVTISCALIGTSCAWIVARSDLPGRRFLAVALAAPLSIPTYVAAYTWLSISGISGFTGSFLVLTTCCYPYVYLPVLSAFTGIDARQEEVARSLGANRRAVFRRVTLPLLRSSITSGSLLVALYVLSDFGAVSLMRFDVFTTSIFLSYRGSFDRTPAAILGCLLAVATIAIVALEARSRRESGPRTARGAARQPNPSPLGRWSMAAWGLMALVVVTSLAVPLVTLAKWALDSPDAGVSFVDLRNAIVDTLGVSLGGALFTTLLALPVGLLAARYRTRFVRVVESASYLGHALPGLVIALALVFFGVRVATPIYQRLPMLIIGYAVLFLPLAVGSARTSIAQAPVAFDEVARSLGNRPPSVIRRVLMPITAPGIGAGAALVFLACVKELPATLLLRPTGLETLASRLWTETAVADYGRAAPYAIAIVLVASIPTFLLTTLSTRPVDRR
jgi:iron(III) transport system permease protein